MSTQLVRPPLPKVKRPLAEVEPIARELVALLAPDCERIEIAGSIRRRKPMVGDVEIIYVPKLAPGAPSDFFAPSKPVNLCSIALEELLRAGVLLKRKNVNGSTMWGDNNKLALHAPLGIPVDFFETSEEAWFNYLVCRTGGTENNKAIAVAANRKNWTWHPYGTGFEHRATGEHSPRMNSEQDVYAFVGLPFLPPERRR